MKLRPNPNKDLGAQRAEASPATASRRDVGTVGPNRAVVDTARAALPQEQPSSNASDLATAKSHIRRLIAWTYSGACGDCDMFRAAPSCQVFVHHKDCAHFEVINAAYAFLGQSPDESHSFEDPKAEMRRLADERLRRCREQGLLPPEQPSEHPPMREEAVAWAKAGEPALSVLARRPSSDAPPRSRCPTCGVDGRPNGTLGNGAQVYTCDADHGAWSEPNRYQRIIRPFDPDGGPCANAPTGDDPYREPRPANSSSTSEWDAEDWREQGPMCTRCHTTLGWEGDDPECEEDAICHDCAWRELEGLRSPCPGADAMVECDHNSNEIRLLRELEAELRNRRSNRERRLSLFLRQLNELRGIQGVSLSPEQPPATPSSDLKKLAVEYLTPSRRVGDRGDVDALVQLLARVDESVGRR